MHAPSTVVQSPARPPSLWLEQQSAGPTREALSHARDADVCIVGGGLTGLWTAYELRRADPSLEVVVLEARHVGFGASGRNGGWVLGKLSGSPAAWERRGGPGAARAMALAIRATVAEVGDAVARERIDCAWQQGGSLTVAQTAAQLQRLRAERERELRWGGEEVAWELLDAERARRRVAVSGVLGALYTPHCARVQPAALALGLARAAERAGAVIFESSRVLSLGAGLVHTEGGRVRARRLVLATEAYTVDLPGRRRALLPLNSAMIATVPLGQEVWDQLGWQGAETILDGSHLYTYSQRTADGRVAIGGRGVPYRFGSRTDREGPVPARTVAELRARLGELFEPLREAAVERAWHGVLGVARDWCPTVCFDQASGLAFAGGYAGEGVAASNLAARTLRDLLLGRDSQLARLPWVGTPARRWEPEPLRFLGAHGLYRLYRLADAWEVRSGRSSRLGALADRIAGR